jgi:hypothetical protein
VHLNLFLVDILVECKLVLTFIRTCWDTYCSLLRYILQLLELYCTIYSSEDKTIILQLCSKFTFSLETSIWFKVDPELSKSILPRFSWFSVDVDTWLLKTIETRSVLWIHLQKLCPLRSYQLYRVLNWAHYRTNW